MGMEMNLRGQVKDEKSENEGTKNTKAYKFHTFTLSNSMHITQVPGSRDTKSSQQSLCPGACILKRLTKHRRGSPQVVVSFMDK